MITEKEQRLEEVANLQLKAMHQVLKDLRELAGIAELPQGFYWLRYADYVEVTREGELECWSRGYGNDPNTRCSYDIKVDAQLLADGDVEAFKQRFRAQHLPQFNKARAQQRRSLEADISRGHTKLAALQGDIE